MSQISLDANMTEPIMVTKEVRMAEKPRKTNLSEPSFLRGMGSSLAMPHPSPNIPVELTVHSAGFLAVPGLGGCGPQLTGSVSQPERDVLKLKYPRRYQNASS